MRKWYRMRALANGGAEILIYDEIGFFGVTAKDFIDELNGLGEIETLSLRINSPGGEVFDGIAIYNALKRHKAEITVTIDGLAASIASVIAMAGDKILMPDNAMMMIHDPFGLVIGTADEMRSLAEALDKSKDALVSAYEAKSGLDRAEIGRLMSEETWLSAAEAVEKGFADEVLEAVKLAARFDLKRFAHPPEALAHKPKRKKAMARKKATGRKLTAGALGARLMTALSDAVEDLVTDDRPEDQIVEEMAEEAGLEATAVEGMLAGEGDCPTQDALESFAKILDVEAADLIKAAERDGKTAKPKKAPAKRDGGGKVVDLNAARDDGRKQAMTYVGEVNDICVLAGKPNLAQDFIERQVPLAKVREKLLEARAAESDAAGISGLHSGDHQPEDGGAVAVNPAEIYATRRKTVSGG